MSKKNGAVYTPNLLGQFMATKLFDEINLDLNKTYTLLDPACGEGDLLVAAIDVAKKKHIKLRVYGYDTDKRAIEVAKLRIKETGVEGNFFNTDFIKVALYNGDLKDSLFEDDWKSYDFIIANPPYIRTKDLEETNKNYAKSLGLSGKVDAYQIFMAVMPLVMHNDTILCIITSNKFITNKTGGITRKILRNNFDIREIIDLGDTKLFNASVLPSIIVAKHNKTIQKESKFYSIYETSQHDSSPSDIMKFDNIYSVINNLAISTAIVNNHQYKCYSGKIVFPDKYTDPWSMATDEEYKWAKKVESSFKNRLMDFGKVRVGIKTTADNVFLNQGFDGIEIEKELLHPLISSKVISKWKLSVKEDRVKKILYPMKPSNGKRKAEPVNLDEFPKAKKYLELHYEQLSQRSYLQKSGRKWFEIWVPQDPSLWSRKKIIWPDIANEPNFMLDSNGMYVDGNCYWLVLNNDNHDDILYLILGVCNSDILRKYHEIMFQNRLYSNKYRYITQYVEKYPIPDPNLPESKEIINITKKILNYGESEKLYKRINLILSNILNNN